jgi:hypothetical protein
MDFTGFRLQFIPTTFFVGNNPSIFEGDNSFFEAIDDTIIVSGDDDCFSLGIEF